MHPLIEQGLKENRNLTEPEAKTLLREYGFSVPEFHICTSYTEAAKAAEQLGYPVVMKVVSPDILHKTDVGGVKIGLTNKEDILNAFEEIKKAVKSFSGVIVYHMQEKGVEIIIGALYDEQFEHAIMFGLGGIFVEVLKDVSFRLIPITNRDAKEMITEIKGYPVLTGVRGEPPKDIDAVVNLLLTVSLLVEKNPAIRELDLNPIFVYEKGYTIIDARIVL